MSMTKTKRSLLTTGAAVTLAAAVLMGGGTFAYLQDNTNDTPVINEFDSNTVYVALSETGDGQYDILPGKTDAKDPTVTVTATTDAYVFVTVADTTGGLVDYTVADGWTPLDETNYPGVYYREVTAADNATETGSQSFPVLKDNAVSYKASLTNEDMVNADGSLKTGLTLTFTASAIQKEGFVDAEGAPDLTSAYLAAWSGVVADNYLTATAENFDIVLSSASAGDAIVLAGDTEVPLKDVSANGVTIIGDEGTVLTTANSAEISSNNVTLSNVKISGTFEAGTAATSLAITGDNVTIEDSTLDGGGTGTYGSVITLTNSNAEQTTTLDNVTISGEQGGFRSVMVWQVDGTLLIENSVLEPVCYPINIDGGTGKLVVNNTTLMGWTSYTGTIESATFTDCVFNKSASSWSYGYNVVAAYTDTTFNNCAFDENFAAYAQITGFTWNFNNCTKGGEKITVDNIKTMLSDSDIWNKCTCYVDGVLVPVDEG